MQLRSEAALEDALFSNWYELRTSGRFDGLLPRSSTLEWRNLADDSMNGYVAVDHTVHRQFRLPGASANGTAGVADLVEVYWSVRTRNGEQDPNWPPSLNVNVIELKNVPLQVEDLVQLYRYLLVLKYGLRVPKLTSLIEAERISLYIRGLLLGPEIPHAVAAASALLNHAEFPIGVGKFSLCPVNGITLCSSPRDEEMWMVGLDVPDLLSVGHRLTDQAVLLQSNGRWPVDSEA